MFNLILLNVMLYLCTVILSLMIIFMSYKGFFGVKLQKFLAINSMGELFVSIVMVVGILMFIINLIVVFINIIINIDYHSIDYSCVIDKNNNTQDPVRYWPSGTAQTWGIIGTAAALYRATPGSPRLKTAAALSSLTITIPLNVYLHAVENPNGFNRLMYSWVHYKNTGNWPADIPNNVPDSIIDTALTKNLDDVNSKLNSIPASPFGGGEDSANFLPLNTKDLLSNLSPENLFLNFMGLFRPVGVEGHLDDLIGQQLFIHFLLISIVIGLIVLFTLYFLIQTMYNNKEFYIKRFNNRFIRFYINYQIILTKISLFVLPAFIFIGLIELFVGLYFLITHPIPYEQLPIDLHTYLNKP